MRRSGLFVTVGAGAIGIVFIRLLSLDAQARSSTDPVRVWILAGLTALSIALSAFLVASVVIARGRLRNRRFHKRHPDAVWVCGLSNPDLEAQVLSLGGAKRLLPSFIAAFDRCGFSLVQGRTLKTALRVPWTDIDAILPSDVWSGTRRSTGLEIRLTNATPATLAFIVRDPERPARAMTMDHVSRIASRIQQLMDSRPAD